jgi:hypothetical protein
MSVIDPQPPDPGGPGGGAVDSVNSKTGNVVLTPDDLDDASTAHKFVSAAQLTKLGGIETGADVTDATNVAAAGALMAAALIDDDSMATATADTVPSSESARAYIDQAIADLPQPVDGTGTDIEPVGGLVTLARPIDMQVFTSSGTWTKPQGAVLVRAILIGGGGGGASGYRGAEGTLRPGGGGGAPGGRIDVLIPADDLDSTEAVTVGAAGAGGAAQTTGTSPAVAGNDGTAGGDTILDTIPGDVRAVGGPQGTHASGFLPGLAGTGATGRGGHSYLTVKTAPHENITSNGEAGGGGAGTGRTAANTNTGGGNGGGTAAGLGGSAGAPGVDGVAGTYGRQGSGGGGGVTVGTSGGWAGGDGGFPGGGGGGGSYGNSGNPANSGVGGDGAAGYAVIVSYG